jgi:hypothetical protein
LLSDPKLHRNRENEKHDRPAEHFHDRIEPNRAEELRERAGQNQDRERDANPELPAESPELRRFPLLQHCCVIVRGLWHV